MEEVLVLRWFHYDIFLDMMSASSDSRNEHSNSIIYGLGALIRCVFLGSWTWKSKHDMRYLMGIKNCVPATLFLRDSKRNNEVFVCVCFLGRKRESEKAAPCLENVYTYSSLDDTCFFFLLFRFFSEWKNVYVKYLWTRLGLKNINKGCP